MASVINESSSYGAEIWPASGSINKIMAKIMWRHQRGGNEKYGSVNNQRENGVNGANMKIGCQLKSAWPMKAYRQPA